MARKERPSAENTRIIENSALCTTCVSGGGGGGGGKGGQVTFLRNSGTNPQWVCAIDERYKLVLSVNDRPWLFDAEQDPDELLNFYRRPASDEVTKRLARALQQYGIARGDHYLKHPAIANSLKMCLSATPDQ